MRKHVLSYTLVSCFAVIIWLFAESQSLGTDSIAARLRFAASPDFLIRSLDRAETVTVELKGSRTALASAQRRLGSIELQPGVDNVPTADGKQTIDLLNLLRASPRVKELGITVLSVSPAQIEVEITQLATVRMGVVADMTGVQIVGSAEVKPAEIDVRGPKALLESLAGRIACIVHLSPEQLSRLPDTGPVKVSVAPLLPEELAGVPGAEVRTPTVSLEFSLRARATAETIRIPVQVVMVPQDTLNWSVTLDPQDELLPVRVSGPAELIEAIKQSDDRGLMAVAALTSEDLEAGITAKNIGIVGLRSGVIGPVPAELTVTPERSYVRLSSRRVEASADE